MPLEVIVHHLDQARNILYVADQAGRKIQLRSAPGAAQSAGVGFLHALGEAAGQELLIDCDDDAGLVMAALRAGCRKLLFSGSDDELRRLNQIATRYRTEIRGPADHSPPCLDLSPDDNATVLQAWLDAEARG